LISVSGTEKKSLLEDVSPRGISLFLCLSFILGEREKEEEEPRASERESAQAKVFGKCFVVDF